MANILGIDLDAGEPEVEVPAIEDLVGEGKKFSDDKEALAEFVKKAAHADAHIKKLENENSLTREQIIELKAKVATGEEYLQKLHQMKQEGDNDYEQHTPEKEMPQVDIDGLVNEKFDHLMKQNTAKQNMEKSIELLAQALGSREKVGPFLKDFVGGDKSLENTLTDLGKTNPNALVRLVVGRTNTQYGSGSKGQAEEAPAPMPSLTWTQARKVKKDNPMLYRSHGYQKKLQEAIAANPDFYKQ